MQEVTYVGQINPIGESLSVSAECGAVAVVARELLHACLLLSAVDVD
jgi:hypothetical protein